MNVSDLSISAARRLFWTTFFGTLLLKVVLAAGFPFTGDEAFFYQWGVFPAWGYSDHPPMVGWLLAVLHGISDAPLVLRSVTLLVTSVIALGIVDVLMRHLPAEREAGAWLAGAVYLVRPDQHVGHVLPLDARAALAAYFGGILRERGAGAQGIR